MVNRRRRHRSTPNGVPQPSTAHRSPRRRSTASPTSGHDTAVVTLHREGVLRAWDPVDGTPVRPPVAVAADRPRSCVVMPRAGGSDLVAVTVDANEFDEGQFVSHWDPSTGARASGF